MLGKTTNQLATLRNPIQLQRLRSMWIQSQRLSKQWLRGQHLQLLRPLRDLLCPTPKFEVDGCRSDLQWPSNTRLRRFGKSKGARPWSKQNLGIALLSQWYYHETRIQSIRLMIIVRSGSFTFFDYLRFPVHETCQALLFALVGDEELASVREFS